MGLRKKGITVTFDTISPFILYVVFTYHVSTLESIRTAGIISVE